MKSSRLLPWLRSWSRGLPILHGILIAQLVLLPCPTSRGVWVDVDSDGDGVFDTAYEDGMPPPDTTPPPEPNPDSDGDHLSDADEAAAGSNPYSPDSDGDGVTDADEVGLTGTDPTSADSDGDGVSDYNEIYGNTAVDEDTSGPGETPYDFDGDGIADPIDPDPLSLQNDPDSDGDYVPDSQDSDPYNPAVWNDANDNGINDDAEMPNNDSDGDGVSNDTDSHPGDPSLSNDWNYNGSNDQDEDWDSDSVSNLQDSHPNSNCLWCDWNGNGVNDDTEAGLNDSDGDGVADNADSHAFNGSLWEDWNSNGWNDSAESTNSDGDAQPDFSDSDPQDFNLWEDWNRNGTNDSFEPPPDLDADDDGVNDDQDSDPQANNLWCDWNRNGTNDNNEPPPPDNDNDGHPDTDDSDPSNANLWEDWNHNSYNDSTEGQFLDDDNDTHPNSFDTHPQDALLWSDHNGNGINDEAEEVIITDSDSDGYSDTFDTHPEDAQRWNDHDNNGTNDELEAPPDSDSDGVADEQDESPADYDNDGLTDADEISRGMNPASNDTDGDGLRDGEEIDAGTNPKNVDSDSDGLTDLEELQAYHTDPLVATQVVMFAQEGQTDDPAPTDEPLPTEEPLVEESKVPEPTIATEPEIDVEESAGSVINSNFFIQDEATTSFPSLSGKADKSDLKKTFTIYNTGTADLTGLVISKDGVDSLHYTVSGLSVTTLASGATTTFTVIFKGPAPLTQSRTAVLHITSNDADEGSFDIALTSIVATGIWKGATHNPYFAANLSDRDGDGIPDLVEEMYAPLTVTGEGDLDGDGVNNLDQYRIGRDLRSNVSTTDFDDDGITNTIEEAWSKAYPQNKFSFADAYADPDGDGLLTMEELLCTWGSRTVKDPAAVASNPYLASTGPNNSGGTTSSTYKVTTRAAPTNKTDLKLKWTWRESGENYKAWMNDGLLRRAYRESAEATGKYPADFFYTKYLQAFTVPIPLPSIELSGYDHLPLGYLRWLNTKGIPLPALVTNLPATGQIPPPPTFEVRAQINQLNFPSGNSPTADADQDDMPNLWEAAYKLKWRDPADSSQPRARAAVATRGIAALKITAADIDRLQGANIITLIQQNLDSRSAAHTLPNINKISPERRATFQINIYDLKAKVPTALAARPAATATAAVKVAWEVKRATWQTEFSDFHTWTILNEIDPDHDGLVNADECVLGISPLLADYSETSSRDTDGDGFTDAQELAAGTDAKLATARPTLALQIISGAGQSGTIFQTLGKPIHIQSIYKGPKGGFFPAPNLFVDVTAPNNYTLLAPAAASGAEPVSTDDWRPKTLRIQTDAQGFAKIAVKLPNLAVASLSLGMVVTAPATATNPIRTASSPCVVKVVASTTDTDGDGMTNAWETKPAITITGRTFPAHALKIADPKDATESPLHYSYHPKTPLAQLPQLTQYQRDQRDALTLLRDKNTGLYLEYGTLTNTGLVTAAQLAILNLIDPDHDGRSNLEEFQANPKTNPKWPDYPDTLDRDSDGDGFTNREEINAVPATNYLLATSHPAFSLEIISGNAQAVTAFRIFPEMLVVRVAVAGVPHAGIPLTFTASNAYMRMSDKASAPYNWVYKTMTIRTGADGLAKILLHSSVAPGSIKITCKPVYRPLIIREFTAMILPYVRGSNPLLAGDMDQDQLPDEWEVLHQFNPISLPSQKETYLDTDIDGLTNLEEFEQMTNPRNSDTDGDGMKDGWEVKYGLDPKALADGVPTADLDGDKLSNLHEYILGTDPTKIDTDEDGIEDGWEVAQGLSPLNYTDRFADNDHDGFTNLQEYQNGTLPGTFNAGGLTTGGSGTSTGPGPSPGTTGGPSAGASQTALGSIPAQGRIIAYSRTKSANARVMNFGAANGTEQMTRSSEVYTRQTKTREKIIHDTILTFDAPDPVVVDSSWGALA